MPCKYPPAGKWILSFFHPEARSPVASADIDWISSLPGLAFEAEVASSWEKAGNAMCRDALEKAISALPVRLSECESAAFCLTLHSSAKFSEFEEACAVVAPYSERGMLMQLRHCPDSDFQGKAKAYIAVFGVPESAALTI